mmetsp:Transcript_9729/g.37852  ORF Transcript_9729/g.37852 Transcript_9729/m.37852 type:complete len:270 (-) Transcript_9729:734-1543(-)
MHRFRKGFPAGQAPAELRLPFTSGRWAAPLQLRERWRSQQGWNDSRRAVPEGLRHRSRQPRRQWQSCSRNRPIAGPGRCDPRAEPAERCAGPERSHDGATEPEPAAATAVGRRQRLQRSHSAISRRSTSLAPPSRTRQVARPPRGHRAAGLDPAAAGAIDQARAAGLTQEPPTPAGPSIRRHHATITTGSVGTCRAVRTWRPTLRETPPSRCSRQLCRRSGRRHAWLPRQRQGQQPPPRPAGPAAGAPLRSRPRGSRPRRWSTSPSQSR